MSDEELPPDSVTSEWEPGAVIIEWPNGKRYMTEYHVTRVTKWRMTAFGPINFGSVILGPSRRVEVTPPA